MLRFTNKGKTWPTSSGANRRGGRSSPGTGRCRHRGCRLARRWPQPPPGRNNADEFGSSWLLSNEGLRSANGVGWPQRLRMAEVLPQGVTVWGLEVWGQDVTWSGSCRLQTAIGRCSPGVNSWCPLKGHHSDTGRCTGRAPGEEESRDWGDVAEVKEHKRRPANPELGDRHGAESPFQSQKEPSCQHLHFKLLASGM